ncbi:MAG: S24 family peptidase [Bacillota bacterium]
MSSRRIPILGTIRAGIPILDQENITGYIEVPADLRVDFAIRIIGDSMSWVGITEGDLAFCRLSEIPRSGQIVAVALRDADWGATIKFYVEERGRKLLRAANPAYEDIILYPEEYRIAGVAVKFLKDPPVLADYEGFLTIQAGVSQEWEGVVAKAAAAGLEPHDLEQYAEAVRRVALKAREK